jgi:quinol monooxygenase YgiN
MQRLTIVRYTTKPDRRAENTSLSTAVFDELKAAAPKNLAYAVFRDGDAFVHLFVNLADETADALVDLPAFKAYTADIAARCELPPQAERLEMQLLKAYGFAT